MIAGVVPGNPFAAVSCVFDGLAAARYTSFATPSAESRDHHTNAHNQHSALQSLQHLH